MSTEANTPGCDESAAVSLDSNEPPAKRVKIQACVRCRRRKQKCDNQRPCGNCSKSNERCVDIASAIDPGLPLQITRLFSQDPLAWLAATASLEQRLSRLEERVSHPPSQARSPACSLTTNARGEQTIRSSTPPRPPREEEDGANNPDGDELIPSLTYLPHDLAQDQLLEPQEQPRPPGSDAAPETNLDVETEQALFDLYLAKVQCRYPFLRLGLLRDKNKRPNDAATNFQVNLVFAISLLLQTNPSQTPPKPSHQVLYQTAVTRYLAPSCSLPDRLLHIQAYLLMAMYAMYCPSTERIISISSATIRYCVRAQLHLAATEPKPVDTVTKVRIQMRRRVFWSAYALDRTVSSVFNLPCSIHDSQITVKMYANINDDELEVQCAESPLDNPQGKPGISDVSTALHVLYCRQIQSDILNTTLHRDFTTQLDAHYHWRHNILQKLDRWRALCHRFTPKNTFPSSEWFHMKYNYSLAMLYQPTLLTVAGPAGDWTVRACVQACLIFRKFQIEAPITELWLGLVTMFKCGVALLYCFFGTPPSKRTPAYEMQHSRHTHQAT